MTDIAANLAAVKDRIAVAARKAGRDPATVRLVAVSKRVEAERIVQAVAAGQRLFGENYLQEAQAKISRVNDLLACGAAGDGMETGAGDGVCWHFIGHLQSNKTKAAATDFAMVETVDRFKLAKALNRHAATAGRVLPVLVQVNVGGEAQKAGVAPEQAAELLRALAELPALRVLGLMTMPPMAEDPEESRPHFARLRQLSEEFAGQDLLGTHGPPVLSMGMSADFEVAVEEGANLVRVGTAIFGPR
ncbi:YggS family pyridoxal phosphate-dependent enzyme [Desulfurivibrio dismutans]|uniref:YggS family pyridoxal phosphate-dependent enzyme n=1 Tax=Desulfurivibrio dismutans TaxID=1398908 RepID=UPI0023D99598|nr:YggS family pyridoxal phosphate-dependent enzyme [Desulfurivibrio alkaliphilus]MDF1615351.1 YggS family pyridoxal phosphate-dependent enzyme [Desulfurivibrio alkaliphilus]